MKIKITGKSDPGNSRNKNEDFYGIYEEDRLIILCDGMGGHKGGAHASKLAVKTFYEMYKSLDQAAFNSLTKDINSEGTANGTALIASARMANRIIYNESRVNPEFRGMGTTITALQIQNGNAVICHVGDSRIYLFRKGKLKLLTEDHTWLNELIVDKEINPREAKKFEHRNVITRALGTERSVKIDLCFEPIETGDLFLLCTDGLTKALNDTEIERIISYNKINFNHTIKHLIDDANMKDGSDNITIGLVYVGGPVTKNPNATSSYQTLKSESQKIIALENKILKQKNHSPFLSGKFIKKMSHLFGRG